VANEVGHVFGQFPILTPEKKVDPTAPEPVAVDGHDHVTMVEERRQLGRLIWGHELRRDVAPSATRLQDAVVRRTRSLGSLRRNSLGSSLEVATVEGAEAEARTQLEFFDHTGELEELSKRDGFAIDSLHSVSLSDAEPGP